MIPYIGGRWFGFKICGGESFEWKIVENQYELRSIVLFQQPYVWDSCALKNETMLTSIPLKQKILKSEV